MVDIFVTFIVICIYCFRGHKIVSSTDVDKYDGMYKCLQGLLIDINEKEI